MKKERLKEIMLDQKEVFNSKTTLIEREIDLEKYIATNQVVIITGIRRCGKSSLLYLLKEKMALTASQFCYFNFDDERVLGNVSILEKLYNLHLEVYATEPVLFLTKFKTLKTGRNL